MSPKLGIGHGTPPWVSAGGDGSEGGGDGGGDSGFGWDTDSATSISPDVERTFDHYADSQEFREDTDSFINGLEDINLDQQFIDDAVGFEAGGLSKSWRWDFVHGDGTVGSGCDTRRCGRGMPLGADLDEVWVEVIMRYSNNYTTCNNECNPCDHKVMFLPIKPSGNGRFNWKVGGCGVGGSFPIPTMTSMTGSGIGNCDEPTTDRFVDEEWHSFKWHAHLDAGGDNPEFWTLLDADEGPPDNGESGGTGKPSDTFLRQLLLGRNKDKGRDDGSTENVWIARVRIWHTDPGWGF